VADADTETAPEALRAAMVRFPTLERARWGAIVAALREMGFNAIDVPLVWREHEAAHGVFDFTEGSLALDAMLATVRDAGMAAIVRLGPIATDDAPGLCLPDRVLRDRACQARTKRQNPVVVADPPRLVPLPSIASEAYRREATAWVAAASAALARIEAVHGPVARVIVGDGPHALLRDDPYEMDHHPDARGELAAIEPPHDGPQEPGLAEVRRERDLRVAFCDALVRAATEHGLSRARIVVAVPGAATISPAAHQLAAHHGLLLACPPPIAGTRAIWHQVRHARALAAATHFDVWSGAPPYYPPARGSHTVAAARVALAAGARDFTVRMGCAGDRWVGAVLSERGEARPHAHLWRELLAWAATLPTGEEIAADLVEDAALVEAARAATGVHPLPLGLLALLGLTPGQLGVAGAPLARGGTLGAHEDALATAEQRLIEAGVPVRRVPHAARGGLTMEQGEDPAAFAARAAAKLAAVVPAIEPRGAALVRAVQNGGRVHLVVCSQRAGEARVVPPGEGWTLPGGGTASAGVVLAPGAVLTLARDEEKHARPRTRAPRAAAATKARSTGRKRS
jgi:beta-galactosidase